MKEINIVEVEDLKVNNILNHRPFSFRRRGWGMRFLFLLPLFAHAQPSDSYASSQVGANYKNFNLSEFSQFFHAKELNKKPYKNGDLRTIKIGGYQELITIYLYTDSALTIHEARLEIDSEFVHDEGTNNLARDLVQSFLIDFTCEEDEKKILEAAHVIYRQTPTKDKFSKAVNDVFNGKQTQYSEKLGKCTVSFENYTEGENSYLRVKISD